MLWQQFQIQCRVIHALMIREIIAQYGRTGLGAAWLALEPLTFSLPVLILWSAVRAPFENGVPLMALLWSGYMPVLLFRHIGGRMMHFIRRNAGLMYHRGVTVLDIFVSLVIVEIVQNLASAFILYVLFYIWGALDTPRDPPMLIIGYLYMIWWCAAMGLIVGALCERIEWFEKIWGPVSYTYMFYSGVAYLADWLPSNLRAVALYQPSLQAFEMIRAGLLGNRITTHYDIPYDTFVLGALTVLGLAALRSGRRYVTV